MIITEFQNRKNPVGNPVETTWEEFTFRLKSAVITSETLDEYRAMTNERRTEVKDVGGYVAGSFRNNKRSKSNLIYRYVLAIDADSATPDDIDNYNALYDYTYFVHTTHTSTKDHPRYRWLFPLSREVTSSEYRQLMEEVKTWVGADTIDDTTDQPERLMFWPSVCIDVDYYWWEGGTELLNPDDFVTEDVEYVEPEEYTSIISGEDLIPEGQRNASVFSYAAVLRQQGLDKDLIRQTIDLYNNAYCDPPLPGAELDTITYSVCRYTKGEKIPFDARDVKLDFSDLGEVVEPGAEKFAKYKVERVSDLLKRDIPEVEFVIPDLIPVGLGMLLAPPKFGKSWFCVDLAISIATGTDFLGMPTNKSEVLYAALEDGDGRIKKRINQVSGDAARSGDNLYGFSKVLELPTMKNGEVIEWMEAQLKSNPKIRLIIIDTLQKIRGEIKKNEGVYGYDYRELSELQNFAVKHNISLLLVHHTKKGVDDSDFLGNASGSNGITGALDYMLSLSRKRRKDKTTVLDITGRDVEMKSYVIQMNWSTFRWENLGEEQEVQENERDQAYAADPLVRTIVYNLDKSEEIIKDDQDEVVWSVTPKQLLDAVDQKYHDAYDSAIKIGKRLTAITADLANKDGIDYEFLRTTRDGKTIRLHTFKRERFI